MILKGDCLSCTRVSSCSVTSAEKVRGGFTCQIFEGVPEPEYVARLEMIRKYGEQQAVQAMLDRPVEKGDEEDA